MNQFHSFPSEPNDQQQIPSHIIPPPSSSHSNLYRGLAEQIYFAELEAEDFFQQLTKFELNPQDILITSSKTATPPSNPGESDGVGVYELTSELIVPSNQLVGLYDRVLPSFFSFDC